MIAALAFCLVAGVASADTLIQGQISILEIVGASSGAPGNYDFRIYLAGSPIVCNGQLWAYVNSTEANYNALVAGAFAAKAAGYSVTLHVIQDSSGYCHLEYMDVQ